jgi:hypothetical protein
MLKQSEQRREWQAPRVTRIRAGEAEAGGTIGCDKASGNCGTGDTANRS